MLVANSNKNKREWNDGEGSDNGQIASGNGGGNEAQKKPADKQL